MECGQTVYNVLNVSTNLPFIVFGAVCVRIAADQTELDECGAPGPNDRRNAAREPPCQTGGRCQQQGPQANVLQSAIFRDFTFSVRASTRGESVPFETSHAETGVVKDRSFGE